LMTVLSGRARSGAPSVLRALFFGLFAVLGLVAGGLGGAAALLVGGKGMKDPIPFGPFMAVGALLAILLGHSILSVYVGG